jgi:iron complex transport system permease protein
MPSLVLGCVSLTVCSIVYGADFMLAPRQVIDVLLGHSDTTLLAKIGVNARVPRALMALLVGAALAMAGTLLQGLTRNPLASPDIIGVSEGAVAAVLGWTAFGPQLAFGLINWVLPVVGMVGGLTTASVIYLLTRKAGSAESTHFILIGILIGGVLSSVSAFCLIFLDEDAQRVLGYLNGTLALKTWQDLWTVVVYLVPAFVLALVAVPRANALQLGDDVAVALGQDRSRDRLVVLVAAALLTAGSVAVIGALTFVGLLGPHMARRITGSDLRRLMPASALLGALMVLVADFVARNFQPQTLLGDGVSAAYLPVGIYLALFGVPFMLSLLWRRR